MPIIWVAFSGRADLTATLVGTFVLLLGFQALTVYSQQYALILMGLLLLLTVLFAPTGFVAGIGRWLEGFGRRGRPAPVEPRPDADDWTDAKPDRAVGGEGGVG